MIVPSGSAGGPSGRDGNGGSSKPTTVKKEQPPQRTATLVPDSGYVRLCQDPWSKVWSIHHAATKEAVPLQTPPGAVWDMYNDGDEVWLACRIGEQIVCTKDAAELLAKSLYVDNEGEQLVLSEQKGVMVQEKVTARRLEYTGIKVGIPLGECGSVAWADAAFFTNARDGCHVWWNLLAIYDTMALKEHSGKGSAGKWVFDGITGWERYMSEGFMRVGHVLRSKQYANHTANLDAERTLPFPSCSSVALVVLLCRWSWGNSRLRGERRPKKAQELLFAILQCLGDTWVFNLLLDDEAVLHGDQPWEGRCPVTVQVTSGMMDLRVIFECVDLPTVEVKRVVESIKAGCEADIGVNLFLPFLAENMLGSKAPTWFAMQVALSIGSVVDRSLQAHFNGDYDVTVGRLFQVVQSGVEGGGRCAWQLDAMLTQYQERVQEQTENAIFYTMGGPDASRVGVKKMHLPVASVPNGLVWHNPPQVEADYVDEHELAELTGTATSEEVSKGQTKRQRAWIERNAENDGNWRPKKRRRVPSFCWMRFVDNILSWSTGQGLVQFQYDGKDKKRSDHWSWKRLHLAPDQGPDGVCATNMMLGPLRLNMWVTWDLSHCVHNDVDSALHNSDLWMFSMLFVLAANVPCAPWNENKRWQQAKAVMDSFYQRVKPEHCPIFLSMIANLTEELECSGEVLSASNPEAALWDIVHKASPWHWKDERLQVSRFMGMVQRARDEIPRASSRLLAYSLACIELDYLHGANFSKVFINTNGGTQNETAGNPTSSKRVSAEEKALRSACQNTMAMACMFWSDESNHIRLRVIETCTRSSLRWHQRQNKTLRSKDASGPFALAQLSGEFLKALAECFAVLRREDDLQFCRLTLPGWRDEETTELQLHKDQETASTMLHFSLSLVGARMKRMAWLFRGWPGQTALFLGDQAQRDLGRENLEADLKAFEYCKRIAHDHKTLKTIVERSCMNEIANEQLALCFRDSKNRWGVLNHRFIAWVKDSWQIIMGSQVVEDCFQRTTGMMKRASNLRAAEKRTFSELIESSVLEGSHEHKAVQASAKASHTRQPEVEMTTFYPKMRAATIPDMKKIIGFEDKLRWYSPGAPTLPQKYSDLEVMRLIHNKKIEPRVLSNLWLGSLMKHEHNLLIRRFVDNHFEGQWCFVLLDIPDSAVVVWPAREVKARTCDQVFYEPEPEVQHFDNCVFPVTSLHELKAMTYTCMAPSNLQKQFPSLADGADIGGWRILAVPEGEADAFVRAASRSAWWNLGMTVMQKVAKHIKIDVPKDAKLFGVVYTVVQKSLAIEEAEALEICAKRRLGLGTAV